MSGGRKRIQAEGRFSTPDAAEGSGLSLRNVIFLCEQRLIPVAAGGGGHGLHRELDYDGVAAVAMTGAFYSAGLEIRLASQLVKQIGFEAGFARLSNLESYIVGPYSAVLHQMRELGWDPDDPCMLHKALRTKTNSYRKYTALEWDFLFEVVDRAFVYMNRLRPLPGSSSFVPSADQISALYRIEGLAKGQSVKRRGRKLAEAPAHPAKSLPPAWAKARENFRGMISINASLAIRDALDRVADARQE